MIFTTRCGCQRVIPHEMDDVQKEYWLPLLYSQSVVVMQEEPLDPARPLSETARRFVLREYRAYEHFGKGVWACYEEA